MITLVAVLVVLACLLLSGFFSGSESGMYFVPKDKLALLAARGDRRAIDLRELLKKPGEFISVTLIGNNIVLEVATYAMLLIVERQKLNVPHLSAELVTTLILFLPFFFLGEVFPKATYRMYAQELLLFTHPAIRFFILLFTPMTFILQKINRLLSKLSAEEREIELQFDRHHLSSNLGHAFAGGVLSEEQLDTMAQAMNAGEKKVEHLMIPLLRGITVSVDDDVIEVYRLSKLYKLFEFPVYEGKKSNIIGIINVRELILKDVKGRGGMRPLVIPPVCVEKGEPFSGLVRLFFEENALMVFIRANGRIIGYINRKDAIIKLLR